MTDRPKEKVGEKSAQLAQLAQLASARAAFYREALAAIRAGQLTPAERDAICRPSTRKAGYWRRHLADLRAVLAEHAADKTDQEG